MFEQIRKEIENLLVEVNYVAEVDKYTLLKAVKLMDLYLINFSSKLVTSLIITLQKNVDINNMLKSNFQCYASYVSVWGF